MMPELRKKKLNRLYVGNKVLFNYYSKFTQMETTEITIQQIAICLEIINRLDSLDTPSGLFLNSTWLKLSNLIKSLPNSYRHGKILSIVGDRITYIDSTLAGS